MAKSLKIIISFKQEEIELYNFVKGKRNASCYVKDLIEKDMRCKEESLICHEKNEKENDLGFDF